MRQWVLGLMMGFLMGGLSRAQDYHWPMEAERALTSTFGEYRGGRLHAAIDLKTWGKEGFPVLAVSEGYIYRVRTSPWGYGRAVYVKLDDGRIAIWAHLSQFSEKIEAYVQEEQDRRETYSVNLFFRRDQLPVTKGEIVGYSGSTGIGVPHLHFELRDGENRPINPLTNGFDITDTTPPTVTALALVPLTADSRIGESTGPMTFPPTWNRKLGKYIYTDTVGVWGQIGVGVATYDRADASLLTNKLAPYRLLMQVDAEEVFSATLEDFGYAMTHHGELDRNFMLSQRGLGRFQNLYRMPGNYLPFYGDYRIGDGVLHAGNTGSRTGRHLTPGIHRVTLLAADTKANVCEVAFTLRVAEPPVIQSLHVEWSDRDLRVRARCTGANRAQFALSTDAGHTWQSADKAQSIQSEVDQTVRRKPKAIYRLTLSGPTGSEAEAIFSPPEPDPPALSVHPEYFPEYVVLTLRTDRSLSQWPQVVASSDSGRPVALVTRQLDRLSYQAVVDFRAQTSREITIEVQADGARLETRVIQSRIEKKRGGDMASADGMAMVRIAPDGVYETLFGRILADSTLTDARMVGSAYRFMPDDVAFEKAEVILRYPEGVVDTSKVGIYTWDTKKGWVFQDIGRDSGLYAVNGEVKHLGVFALLVDNDGPEITAIEPSDGQTVFESRPTLRAAIRDTSSGIWREEDIELRIDGQRLISEYDPEENLAFARPRQALAAGVHQVEVVVRDICGNETRRRQTFSVGQSKD